MEITLLGMIIIIFILLGFHDVRNGQGPDGVDGCNGFMLLKFGPLPYMDAILNQDLNIPLRKESRKDLINCLPWCYETIFWTSLWIRQFFKSICSVLKNPELPNFLRLKCSCHFRASVHFQTISSSIICFLENHSEKPATAISWWKSHKYLKVYTMVWGIFH